MNTIKFDNWLRLSALSLAVAGVSVAGLGCEETDPVSDAQNEITESEERIGEAVEDAAEEGVDDTMGEAAELLESAEDEVEGLAEEAAEFQEEFGNMDPAAIAALGEGEITAMIDRAEALIGEGKVDQAKTIIDKLVGMKDQLPASVVEKLDAVQALLDQAGNLQGMTGSLPGAE